MKKKIKKVKYKFEICPTYGGIETICEENYTKGWELVSHDIGHQITLIFRKKGQV